MSPTNFGIKLENIFKCYSNKNIGASALRHIYIIHQKNKGLLSTGKDQDILAYLMAHSANTQQDYFKITNDINFNCTINKEGIKQLCKSNGRPKLVKLNMNKK